MIYPDFSLEEFARDLATQGHRVQVVVEEAKEQVAIGELQRAAALLDAHRWVFDALNAAYVELRNNLPGPALVTTDAEVTGVSGV
jgi:hypothetical protein